MDSTRYTKKAMDKIDSTPEEIADLKNQMGKLGIDSSSLKTEEPELEPVAPEKEAEPPLATPPRQQQEFRKRNERRREEMEELKSSLKETNQTVDRLAKMLEQSIKPKEEVDELETLAKEYQFDPNGMKRIVEYVEKKIVSKLPKEEKKAEQEGFSNEWEQFSDSLLDEFPKASSAQLREAKKTMKELAYLKENLNVPMDYIFYKHKDEFENLLKGGGRKSAESGRVGTVTEDEPDKTGVITNIRNASDAIKASRLLDDMLGEEKYEVHRDGEQVLSI